MKKVSTLLFVGTMLTFAACQSKPKTEETAVDSTAVTMTDTAVVITDSTTTMTTDSTTMMVPDTTKK